VGTLHVLHSSWALTVTFLHTSALTLLYYIIIKNSHAVGLNLSCACLLARVSVIKNRDVNHKAKQREKLCDDIINETYTD